MLPTVSLVERLSTSRAPCASATPSRTAASTAPTIVHAAGDDPSIGATLPGTPPRLSRSRMRGRTDAPADAQGHGWLGAVRNGADGPSTKGVEMATLEKQTTTYAPPGQPGSPVELKERYDNFIGGTWVPPLEGEYSENPTPATGEVFTEVPRSTPADVELRARRGARREDGLG